MKTEDLNLLLTELRSRVSAYRNGISEVRATTSAFRKDITSIHTQIIMTKDRFDHLINGDEQETPVRNIKVFEQVLKQTGS